VSPLDALADRAFLSAHMLQHLLLLLVAPSLALAAWPAGFLAALGGWLATRPVLRGLLGPGPVLAQSVVIVWLWHAPRLYDAALLNAPLHVVEHVSFLASATLFWWPLLRPATYPLSFGEPVRLACLFGAAIGSGLLGAVIALSPDVSYPFYAQARAYPELRSALGFTPLIDQQVGGILMWAVGGVWYALAAAIVFVKWLGRDEQPELVGDRP
jgi:cytochrome c oxidase assembly factor CtaG